MVVKFNNFLIFTHVSQDKPNTTNVNLSKKVDTNQESSGKNQTQNLEHYNRIPIRARNNGKLNQLLSLKH